MAHAASVSTRIDSHQSWERTRMNKMQRHARNDGKSQTERGFYRLNSQLVLMFSSINAINSTTFISEKLRNIVV
jgi:hypothetical protein